MCGDHIRKVREGEWSYPDHESLLEICELATIDTYLERRRSTLLCYLEANRAELLSKARNCSRHCRDNKKVLWWEQSTHNSLI